jgi:hypothetical protein
MTSIINVVEKNVIDWANIGKRNRTFASKIGGSACHLLFFLSRMDVS